MVDSLTQKSNITKSLRPATNLPKALVILAIISLISGVATGYVLSKKSPSSGGITYSSATEKTANEAGQASQNCKDFDEGTLRLKQQPEDPSEYSEGTHILERVGKSPVTLTSSYVDLAKFEDKKVKVTGETQKALKSGWLMDVCKIEQI